MNMNILLSVEDLLSLLGYLYDDVNEVVIFHFNLYIEEKELLLVFLHI